MVLKLNEMVMLKAWLTLVLAGVCGVGLALASPKLGSTEEWLFKDFIERFNKTYANSIEYFKRFEIFKASLTKHEQLNSLRTHRDHARYGITKFADLTTEEFVGQYLSSAPHPTLPSASWPPVVGASLHAEKSIPLKYDMRSIKPSVISPVRNQKSCGACWAFSVVETVESRVAMKTKRLTQLSPQELVDCGTAAGDSGCHGGVPCRTLDWLNRTKTEIVTDATYPYKAKKGDCKIISSASENAVVSGYTCGNYTTNEAVAMPTALYLHGPLSISADAESWQYYLNGIIQYHCTPNYLNHAVQIVGYDRTAEIPYYMVRNSWGADWGIDGYLHIMIGGNVCGVASAVQTVTV
ncbi:cathepsin O-like [Diadema setosum]|uniref:cathepsin O-like n=1 Tax=Diadema setosum TaxID=31175 RepID=UPI003B3B7816